MQPFTKLNAVAAPLPLINIDTDMIIPKQFLKTIKRTGLGVHLFEEMRYHESGEEIADFVLNRPAFRKAQIIVSGDNFGCGSSREHAPWALADFGIRAIIAPSFADIFYNNCFKNGILPIQLPVAIVDSLVKQLQAEEANVGAAGSTAGLCFDIDLKSQIIKTAKGEEIGFELDPFRKHCLLEGLDDIGLTGKKADKIDQFEAAQKKRTPWLYTDVA